MTVAGPVAVQLRSGPVHLAFPVTDARLVAVCGAHFGSASAVPAEVWIAPETAGARVCAACDDAASAAHSLRQLRAIAGV
jgi:hypothetical protein